MLHLRGGLKEGAMVLEGDGPAPNGVMIRQRVTWTLAFDGWYARTP